MRIYFVIVLFLFFACTIIEDSDITSQEELDNLTFTSIEIKQETSNGNSTLTAKVSSDSSVNISTPDGTIEHTVWMNWPTLNSKLKLKSGFTKAFKSYTSYLNGGKPYTFYLFDIVNKDTVILELYRFRYDTKGRLNQIITNAPFVDGGPATSRDTLVYSNSNNLSEVTSIIRRSADPSKTGTFTINAGSIFNLQAFSFQGNTYTKACQGDGCPGPYWGGGYYSAPNNGNQFPFGVMDLSVSIGYYNIDDRNKDINATYCNSQCSQGNDTYYLHPIMILKDEFELGNPLLFLYMVDWWQPIAQQESTTDEKVTISFKYDL